MQHDKVKPQHSINASYFFEEEKKTNFSKTK